MNKKLLALFLAVLMICTLATGCTSQQEQPSNPSGPATANPPGESSPASEPITIEFWNNWTNSDGEVLDDIVDRFNKTNEYGITIAMDRDSEMKTKLLSALAANEAPTFVILSGLDIASFARQGNIVPISNVWDKTTLDKGDFVSSILDLCNYDSELYMLPMQINARFLYWNKTLLANAGFDAEKGPQTWAELAEMAKAITDPSKGTYGGGIPYDNAGAMMTLMVDYGGEVLTVQDGKARSGMYSDASKNALGLWKQMIDDGSMPVLNMGDCNAMMQAGTLGFTISGPALSVGLSDYIDYGVSVLPAGPATQSADITISGFAVTKSATPEEIEAAYRFFEYWNNTAPETAKDEFNKVPVVRWSTECGFPPYLASVRNNEEISSMEPLATFSTFADYVYDFYPSEFTGIGFLVNNVFPPMLEEIAYGNANDIDSILLKYHELLDDWEAHVN